MFNNEPFLFFTFFLLLQLQRKELVIHVKSQTSDNVNELYYYKCSNFLVEVWRLRRHWLQGNQWK